MVLIIILVIVGWLFIRSVTFGVSLVTNGNRQINMSRMITASIDNRLNHIENVMKTGALVALQKRMTENNSTIFRDSLGKMDQIDTVYLSTNKLAEVEAVKKCLARVDSSGVGVWSEPYLVEKDSTKVPVVSFITPLKNSHGKIYSSLCANVRLDWLDELARREVGHESGAKVSVITGNDIYVYYTDSVETTLLVGVTEDTIESYIQLQKSIVKPTDIFICLGDMIFDEDTDKLRSTWCDLFAQMNGKYKFLVLGNNDLLRRRFYIQKCGFDTASLSLKLGNIVFTHCPIHTNSDKIINIHGHVHRRNERRVWINRSGTRIDYDGPKHASNEVFAIITKPVKLTSILRMSENEI